MDQIFYQAPDDGEQFMIAGGSYRVIIPGEDTGGSFAMIEMTVPPGAGPGPHAHANFQESFYVLEGEVELQTEAGRQIAVQGSLASIPRGGMIHSFKNISDKPATLICTVVPAGLENFFRDIAGLMNGQAAPGPDPDGDDAVNKGPSGNMDKGAGTPDLSAIQRIAEKYGQTLYPPDYWATRNQREPGI